MDVIMALLTNITRDMELIKKTLERMNDNVKFGTLVKKVEVRDCDLTNHTALLGLF